MLVFIFMLFGQFASAAQPFTIVSHAATQEVQGYRVETRVDGYDASGRIRISLFHTRVYLHPNPTSDSYSFTFLDPDNRASHASTLSAEEYRKIARELKSSPVSSKIPWPSNGCTVTVELNHGPMALSSSSTCPPK